MNSRRFIQSPYREDEADSQAFRNPGLCLINVELHWLLFWWQRAQIRDDSVQVAISHARVPREPHRRLQAATILTDALVMARLISASLHAPIPFSWCEVMFLDIDSPNGPRNV
jgi:hypothetical protein